MSRLRYRIANSDSFAARALIRCRRAVTGFTLPAPRLLVRPLLAVFLALRSCYYLLVRLLICEPLFKAYCTRYGRGLRTGVYIHWVNGSGEIVLGDNVLVDGKCNFTFAARYTERPRLTIGDGTGVGHGCSFTVGREIAIGKNCRIAAGCHFFDTPGHPNDPGLRKAGYAADNRDVRAIRVGDNVWIGTDAVIFPGVTVGEGSIVATRAVVISDVPPYAMVAGNPARVIRFLRPAGAAASLESGPAAPASENPG